MTSGARSSSGRVARRRHDGWHNAPASCWPVPRVRPIEPLPASRLCVGLTADRQHPREGERFGARCCARSRDQ
jgi:hypothetical protein